MRDVGNSERGAEGEEKKGRGIEGRGLEGRMKRRKRETKGVKRKLADLVDLVADWED